MSRLTTSRIAAILAAAALPLVTLPGGAFAQTTPAAPSSSTKAAMPNTASAKVEQHIKQLHDELEITSAQQPQWEQFAQVMRDNAAQMSQAFTNRGAKLATMNAADDMQSYAHLAQLHATNMQKLASAFQSLYNAFPAQQKQVADNVFRNKPAPHKR